MPNYLRPDRPGACIFFTVALNERGASHLTGNIGLLRQAVRQTMVERPFRIEACVVLPDHLHMIWKLPPGDADFSTRWSVIKARFSRQMEPGPRRLSHVARRERGLWQRRFWEHHLRGPAALAEAVACCHEDPVKHGLVARPEDWLYSSIHRARDIASGAAA
ncbi:REP-associated tyrosine transposase [Aestuariicoccus sp. MJ-SS9]|uniref:REP-associated tyrosine transposase n=1 Tax=Aestuariicoccus sp. MJ-SS9 TaxID=3079855 RepID=UPI0029079E7A|nr:transposase [Aestuariicoccus sp. MJ-SS9]MDU8912423.1 transposase [Aestuariicoccus sp. MJ-SS9]